MTIGSRLDLQNGGINDPERIRGRKYHLSFSNTFETVAG